MGEGDQNVDNFEMRGGADFWIFQILAPKTILTIEKCWV